MTISTYGVTPAGFIRPSLDAVLTDQFTQLVEAFGISVDQAAESIIGQHTAITASAIDSIFQLAEKVKDQLDPDKAEGEQQDQICALNGTKRKLATYTTANLLVIATTGTVIPGDSLATNDAGDIVLRTLAPVTAAAITAWATGATIAIGDVRRTAAGHCYVAIAGGTTLGSGTGPSSVTKFPSTVIDGTVTWVYVGDGTGFAYVSAQATVVGKLSALAFAITKIGTPVAGWATVCNPQDATTGRNDETDAELKQRRVVELKPGSVRAEISDINAVTAVTVFENFTDSTNADGMTPHSVEALVSGSATDLEIAQALWRSVPDGIGTNGAHSHNITDDQGGVMTLRWSVPSATTIYVEATLYVDDGKFPTSGGDVAKALVLAFGDALPVGRDVDPSAIGGELWAAMKLGTLPGLLATSVKVKTSSISGGDPANVPVVVGSRAQADFDSTRISIVVVPRAP